MVDIKKLKVPKRTHAELTIEARWGELDRRMDYLSPVVAKKPFWIKVYDATTIQVKRRYVVENKKIYVNHICHLLVDKLIKKYGDEHRCEDKLLCIYDKVPMDSVTMLVLGTGSPMLTNLEYPFYSYIPGISPMPGVTFFGTI